MRQSIRARQGISRIAWDCFVDLGVTVVYATIAGLLIVGIVASDDGPASLLSTACYACLLPASVSLLIGLDIVARIAADRRASRIVARCAAQAPRALSRS